MPKMQFPGAWPDSPSLPPSRAPSVMETRSPSVGDSVEEPPRPSSPPATQFARKHPPLRIIVPPTEYCPFSTDLTLPITPLSLPTPVSSSCFTFSDMQDFATQNVSVPPTPAPVLPSSPQVPAVADLASPTSSQFLLMPPTPRLENMDGQTDICVSPLATPSTAKDPIRSGSHKTNLRPWEVSSSTWLTDLGGHTETDRIFRHNLLLGITLLDTESSPASTPALSPSAVSPSSQASSILAYTSPTSLARSPASLPAALSPYPCTMSPQSSPARLILKPTGTDTFPSTLDSLQAWRENVAPGLPRPEDPRSPPSPCQDVPASQSEEVVPETPIHASSPSPLPRPLSPCVSRASRSQTLIKQARILGSRVKRFVTRRSVHRHCGSMDQDVNFRIVTSPDSENGSVILITAPPPPYDVRPAVQEHARPRTISEYSSAVQSSTAEFATTSMNESGTRRGGGRNALRRLSVAALSTIKRL